MRRHCLVALLVECVGVTCSSDLGDPRTRTLVYRGIQVRTLITGEYCTLSLSKVECFVEPTPLVGIIIFERILRTPYILQSYYHFFIPPTPRCCSVPSQGRLFLAVPCHHSTAYSVHCFFRDSTLRSIFFTSHTRHYWVAGCI